MAGKKSAPEEHIWERQEGETGPAWEAFRAFLELGEKRTVAELSKVCKKHRSLLDVWCKQWEWRKRAAAYDNYIFAEEVEKTKKERREMNRRHIALSLRLQKAATEALEKKNFSRMSDKDIANFIRIATELERLARGDDRSILESKATEEQEEQNDNTIHIILPDNGRL